MTMLHRIGLAGLGGGFIEERVIVNIKEVKRMSFYGWSKFIAS